MPAFRPIAAPTLLTVLVLSAATCFAQQIPERPEQQVVAVTSPRSDLEIIEKFVKVAELEHKIKRVDGFDPQVVNVVALSAKQIRIQALAQGVTTISLTDENGNSFLIDVFIKGDARHLQAILDTKFPDAAVEAFKVRESVVLRGWVTQPDQITQIVEISEQFYPEVLNQMRVGGEQQILLQVKVLEVQRSKIRELGMNLLYLNRNSYVTSTPNDIVNLSKTTLPFGSGPTVEFDASTLKNATLSFALLNNNNIFNGFLEALKQESLLKILAEPRLVATNGRPSSLLSGGEFPIIVPQSLGTSTIEWREFGVRLETVPTVLGNGRLRMELQTEVSERDFTNAVDLNGLTVPGLTTRRANTQVEMHFGETMMIGGLISNRRTSNTDKVPVLGELPVVGAAFRAVRYDDVETELVIMVTPQMTAPMDPGQVPAGGPGTHTTSPSDRELYLDGFLEVPNYGDGLHDRPGMMGPSSQPVKSIQQIPTTIESETPSDLTTLPQVPPSPATSATTRRKSLGLTFFNRGKSTPSRTIRQVSGTQQQSGQSSVRHADYQPNDSTESTNRAGGFSKAPNRPGYLEP